MVLRGAGPQEEVRTLVGDVYGSGFKANHRVQRILDVIDANGDGRVSFREFQDFNRRYPMILFPAFTMQQDLRRRVFGESRDSRAPRLPAVLPVRASAGCRLQSATERCCTPYSCWSGRRVVLEACVQAAAQARW